MYLWGCVGRIEKLEVQGRPRPRHHCPRQPQARASCPPTRVVRPLSRWSVSLRVMYATGALTHRIAQQRVVSKTSSKVDAHLRPARRRTPFYGLLYAMVQLQILEDGNWYHECLTFQINAQKRDSLCQAEARYRSNGRSRDDTNTQIHKPGHPRQTHTGKTPPQTWRQARTSKANSYK